MRNICEKAQRASNFDLYKLDINDNDDDGNYTRAKQSLQIETLYINMRYFLLGIQGGWWCSGLCSW